MPATTDTTCETPRCPGHGETPWFPEFPIASDCLTLAIYDELTDVGLGDTAEDDFIGTMDTYAHTWLLAEGTDRETRVHVPDGRYTVTVDDQRATLTVGS